MSIPLFLMFAKGKTPNAKAHRELPTRDFSDSAEPPPGSNAVARVVRRFCFDLMDNTALSWRANTHSSGLCGFAEGARRLDEHYDQAAITHVPEVMRNGCGHDH
jgi:hypothetical protein